jgi:UDPglucose--hexose-1-phosphate uridylyltransferase
MSVFDRTEHPHRRLNALTGEWVLVSPHRSKRPWQGQVEATPSDNRPPYDPTCYLCPRNTRAGGVQNPDYPATFVFDNDFPALLPSAPSLELLEDELFQTQAERGVCRVICFSPRHDWTLAHMPPSDIRRVVDVWAMQTQDLATNYPWLSYVQVFENKGEIMGCSNPHPHGQIWATERLPREVAKEDERQLAYFAKHGRTLLSAYLAQEQAQAERVVVQNEHWTVLVPFWAVWPFEILLVSQRSVAYIADLEGAEREALADILSRLTIRYDNLFKTSFPYSMGFHQAPVNQGTQPHWHLHAHFYPPLLRSATVKKFMVGYEMLGTPQRDITPESAAARLRDLPEIHYETIGKA